MAISWSERHTSRGGSTTNPTVTLRYTAFGESDDLLVRAFATAAIPGVYVVDGGTVLYRQEVQFDWQSSTLCHIDAAFGAANMQLNAQEIGFDTTGGMVHITSSKETINSYFRGVPFAAPPDHKQAIGVNGDQIEGVDVFIPALKLDVEIQHPAGLVNLFKVKQLARDTAIVNSDTFLTFAPGEVLFLGASGKVRSFGRSPVRYSFAVSENTVGQTIGDIANIAKRGHDYLWVSYVDDVDNGQAVRIPANAYVERVYRYSSMVAALGFGG